MGFCLGFPDNTEGLRLTSHSRPAFSLCRAAKSQRGAALASHRNQCTNSHRHITPESPTCIYKHRTNPSGSRAGGILTPQRKARGRQALASGSSEPFSSGATPHSARASACAQPKSLWLLQVCTGKMYKLAMGLGCGGWRKPNSTGADWDLEVKGNAAQHTACKGRARFLHSSCNT